MAGAEVTDSSLDRSIVFPDAEVHDCDIDERSGENVHVEWYNCPGRHHQPLMARGDGATVRVQDATRFAASHHIAGEGLRDTAPFTRRTQAT
ncbi:hypothetical protein C8039_10360 [Halogeometricum sp. wsp3]|nr:hypothetical protein C8039_10360 [Halogeometricum sp. wsp3]